jgi:hypothetical protein
MKFISAFIVLVSFSSFNSLAQDAAHEWAVQLSVTVTESPASVTLNWPSNTAAGTTYNIFRKEKGTTGWGPSIGSVPSSTLTYTDDTPLVGVSYEYLVQKVSGTLNSWGYVNAGIKTELPANRGYILIIVDNTFSTNLSTEINQLSTDLYNDGWMPKVIEVSPTDAVTDVKALIQTEYTTLNNLKAVYLLGNVPVPYSGNIYPDGHTDHEGAWPADGYYGDLDGSWTDASINNTVATDPRNDNIPGDGKFDQSTFPSDLELEICRVDFNDLPVFSDSEEDLLRNYLDRAHDFKIGAYVPQEKALYDQGGFTGMAEGFAQNGLRNFAPFIGDANIEEVDYFTTLSSDSYLWSYGCGAGSYTSAGALNNGSNLTSSTLGSTPMNAVFTMLFGSYFGDWDKTNNLLRSALANGKTLSISWAGRPAWQYHTMAQGDNLGYAAILSMNSGTDYVSLNSSEGVHMAQFGDPSLRVYYLIPPTNLTVSNNGNVADLSWTASTDVSVEGYNVYRRQSNSLWEKVNTSLITSTSYSDASLVSGGDWEYMVKSVKLKTNSSGTFYNESLGTSAVEQFDVGVKNNEVDVRIYPNPAVDKLTINSQENIEQIELINLQGKVVFTELVNAMNHTFDLSQFEKGSYILVLRTSAGISSKPLVKM